MANPILNLIYTNLLWSSILYIYIEEDINGFSSDTWVLGYPRPWTSP